MQSCPVVNYEGIYQIREDGQICSLDRVVVGRDGVKYPKAGRVLRPSPHKDVEYLQVSLWRDNLGISHYVHRLVAQSFVPNPENLPEVNHKDGNRLNCHFSNLEWVTSQSNKVHAVETGLRVYTNRLTREDFIDCLYAVLEGESYASLCERVPYKVPFLSTKVRKLASELNMTAELDNALYLQRVERARINGAKNHRNH